MNRAGLAILDRLELIRPERLRIRIKSRLHDDARRGLRQQPGCLRRRSLAGFALTLLWAAATLLAAPADEVERHRQLGRACYENEEFKAAAGHYRAAIDLGGDRAADWFNLGLTLMRDTDHEAALAALERAGELDPKLVGVTYVRAIIEKREGRHLEAIHDLTEVTQADPECLGALYNLGICHKAMGDDARAIKTFLAALELAPEDPACQYQLVTLYRRIGDVENATRHAEIFDRVKDTVDEAERTAEALERSRYSDLLDAAPMPIVPFPGWNPPPDFARATAHANFGESGRGSALACADYDGDGLIDLYVVNCSTNAAAAANRLYRNRGGLQFQDVTADASVGDQGRGRHAVWGDLDNDGHPDLYVVNDGPNVLYLNRGDGSFEDVSASSRTDEPQSGARATMVDYDHDNDLDLLVLNHASRTGGGDDFPLPCPDGAEGQANTLLRNNGDRTFSDRTDEAGLLVDFSASVDVVTGDLDSDQDTDVFVANCDSPCRLFLNARRGVLKEAGRFEPPLEHGSRAVAEADFNRDGRPDLAIGTETALWMYRNENNGRFRGSQVAGAAAGPAGGIARIRVADLDNDGWPDLVVVSSGSPALRLLRGVGDGTFGPPVLPAAFGALPGIITDLWAADLDRDGDEDLLVQTRDHGPQILRNDLSSPRRWLAVDVVGRKANRSAYGAAVEVVGPGYYQRQTVRDGRLHFGLGSLDRVYLARVTWPGGMVQNLLEPPVNSTVEIEEYVKVSASCAFLWAEGEDGWELINEVLGIGPLGAPMSATECFPTDCTELTKIESHQLRARDGRYELRLTEDLREVAYVDRIELRVIDHPAGCEIIPNEMFTGPPFPKDRIFAVAAPCPPRSAVDDRGNDVLELVRTRDHRFPTFPLTAHDGLAEPHSLTLDLGDLSSATRIMLFLDGWIYWADASVCWGLFQNDARNLQPLKLEVPDAQGEWRTAVPSVGLPTSKGAVVPVDLTGQFPAGDFRIRLSTTLCVYFDRIFVGTEDHAAVCREARLGVVSGALRQRGFAAMERDAQGYERFDYGRVSPTGAWNPPAGHLTRFGEVTELLQTVDDMFVVFGPGDELQMQFDATTAPPIPPGWRRSFVFYANGWVKDGDPNTLCSATVEPLPHHAMTSYPYPATEPYPDDEAHREYLRAYQTRPATATVGDLTRFVREE